MVQSFDVRITGQSNKKRMKRRTATVPPYCLERSWTIRGRVAPSTSFKTFLSAVTKPSSASSPCKRIFTKHFLNPIVIWKAPKSCFFFFTCTMSFLPYPDREDLSWGSRPSFVSYSFFRVFFLKKRNATTECGLHRRSIGRVPGKKKLLFLMA